MNALEQLVREEILTRGPMRFDRFMELALYHPEHGYYAQARPIGRTGDFFTSVSVGPLFGRLLAWQFRQMAELLDEPEFWIVEQGAHDGRLARDILEEGRHTSEFWDKLRYLIVEPSSARREEQARLLADFGPRVRWLDRLEAWKGEKPAGGFFSNELADALPVRLIEGAGGDWHERRVGLDSEQGLNWTLADADAELRLAIGALPLVPMDGFRTEIGLAARAWASQTARFLRRGYRLTIDYGFPASAYYAPFRRDGTLTCYRQHRRGDDVLDAPGEQDITAHVDFTALARAGERAGLETLGLVDQMHFLIGIVKEHVERGGRSVDLGPDVKAWQTLTHPSYLGERFKVLVQGRDAPAAVSGLHFGRGGQLD
jgi:SAM-dependent MidA family methyltransferase